MNSTGEEVLEFTSWELRKITGHKVYLDMIDDHCSTVICTNGWIGFKDIEIKNANTTVIGLCYIHNLNNNRRTFSL